MPSTPQAPPGYVPTHILGISYPALVQYLKTRGYSDDLAQTMAANIQANPEYRGNAEMLIGAKAWEAEQASRAPAQNFPTAEQMKLARNEQGRRNLLAMDNPDPRVMATAAGLADGFREADPLIVAQQTSGMKADSLASYFQRLGLSAEDAIKVAHHATGTPVSSDRTPQQHISEQTAEHPPIPVELYKSVIGEPQNIEGN